MPDALKRMSPERLEELRTWQETSGNPYYMVGQGLELIAEIDALRANLASFEKERNEAQDRVLLAEGRQIKAECERESALADCKALATEVNRLDGVIVAMCRAHGVPDRLKPGPAIQAALARHGGGE